MAATPSSASAAEPTAVPLPAAAEISPSLQPASVSRATATARLAASPQLGSQLGSPSQHAAQRSPPHSGAITPLAGPATAALEFDTGRSALAAAFTQARGQSPARSGTPPVRALSPNNEGILHAPRALPASESGVIYDPRPGSPGSMGPHEDPDVIARHLVMPSNEELDPRGKIATSFQHSSPRPGHRPSLNPDQAPDLDDFSSLQLEGGDVHRGVYRWAEEAAQARINQRSKSFTAIRPYPEDEVLDIQTIKIPGGFRRNFLRRSAEASASASTSQYGATDHRHELQASRPRQHPAILTNNFIEFLTLYGHFAGEELEEDDDEDLDDYFSSDYRNEGEDDEDTALLTPRTPGGRKRPKRPRPGKGRSTPLDAFLLLLKSFVGTGVLFLPKAFLNGGIVFSSIVLVAVAALSYWCFILLVNTRLKVEASFGDMGGLIYGRVMRALILSSIVLSQFGFVSAYIVFISQNLQAFILAVSKCRTWIDIKWMVLMQLVIFLPLSLIRDISKLGFTALIADVFILLGLVYLYYFDISSIVSNHGLSDVVAFNPSTWTGFIGTAIFTFEGIGLIIPIQESMKNPRQFPPVLGLVMIIITTVFTSIGALSYGAFGSATKTVVILNLPQDSKFVNGVQFLYSLAILLSTPLQLFPAIRILETELFTRSGKNNPWVKWRKNAFRFFLVMVCALVAWGGASDLDKFVSIVGSFACVPLVYVYPPLLHYRAVARTRLARISDLILAMLGFVGMGYTTILTARSWGQSPAGAGPGYCEQL